MRFAIHSIKLWQKKNAKKVALIIILQNLLRPLNFLEKINDGTKLIFVKDKEKKVIQRDFNEIKYKDKLKINK